MLTEEQVRRIKEAIKECDSFIGKEEQRSSDLRPKDTQQYLDFCKTHRVKLLKMLETNTFI